MLLLTVSYEPAAKRFSVALCNQSKETLALLVETRQFRGRIVVTRSSGKAVEYVDSRFYMLMMTSDWSVPKQSVKSQAEIVWKLPLTGLCDIHRNKLDVEALQGATVHATLDEVAVIASQGTTLGSNAKQVSKPVTIPSNEK